MQSSVFGFFLLSFGKDIQIVQIKSLTLYIKEARIKTFGHWSQGTEPKRESQAPDSPVHVMTFLAGWDQSLFPVACWLLRGISWG